MDKISRTSDKDAAFLKYSEYQKLWRIVEGAVVDAIKMHPDYVTDQGRHSMVKSITKRVVGSVIHNAKRTRKGGRLGGCNPIALAKTPMGSSVSDSGPEQSAECCARSADTVTVDVPVSPPVGETPGHA